MTARAVVVEDEADTRELIDLVLSKNGIEVHGAETGEEGLRLVRDLKPELVTLDVQLPDMQGTEVCRRLREFSDAFVMMITSRSDEVDRLLALDLGADDYLPKPFSTRELGARSAALLRRARTVAEAAAEQDDAEVVQAGGGLVLVPVRHVAMFEGAPVPLTPPEVDVLAVLARDPGRAWDRSELVSEVWGGEFIESDYLIDVHVANLRRKLRKAGAGNDRIRTVEGTAYALASA